LNHVSFYSKIFTPFVKKIVKGTYVGFNCHAENIPKTEFHGNVLGRLPKNKISRKIILSPYPPISVVVIVHVRYSQLLFTANPNFILNFLFTVTAHFARKVCPKENQIINLSEKFVAQIRFVESR
jgi:hypothetical protein